MNKPWISVILPTHGRPQLLRRAVESVLSQSFDSWELIIVDDGSPAETKQVMQAFLNDERIYYYYQDQQGVAVARNYGIQQASASYLTFLDDDDFYLPDHLARYQEVAAAADYPEGLIRSEAFVQSGSVRRKLPAVPLEQPFRFLWDKGDGVVFYAFHRKVLAEIRFHPAFSYAEDWHLLVRCMQRYSFFMTASFTQVIGQTNDSLSAPEGEDAIRRAYESAHAVVADLEQTLGVVIRQRLGAKSFVNKRIYFDLFFGHLAARQGNSSLAVELGGQAIAQQFSWRSLRGMLRIFLTLIRHR